MQVEARFRQLADSVPGMIYQFRMAADGSTCFPFVSSGCRELLELEPDAIQRNPEHLLTIIHAEDRPGFERSITHSALTLKPWCWEGRFILPSKQVRWIQGASRPEQQSDGAIVWSGQLMDISQRKHIEAILKQLNDDLEERVEERTRALLESQAQFQQLAANIPGVIYQCRMTPDSIVSFPYLSEGCQDIYEVPAAQIDQQPFQLVHPDDQQTLQQKMQHSAATLCPFQQEYRIIAPSGRLKWVQAISRPTRQADGAVLWDGVLIDIHDRKMAEAALQQSEAQFRQLFEHSADAILLLDLEKLCFTDCNQAAITMLRCVHKQQVIGLTPLDISPEVQPDGCLSSQKVAELAVITSEQRGCRFEWMHQRFDGELFWVEVLLTPMSLNEQSSYQCVWRDISARKQTEAALKQSESRFRELFEHSADAILLLDGEVFTDCNEATVKMLRCANKEQALQLHPSVLSPAVQPDGRSSFEKANEMIAIAFQQGTHRFEWMHRRADQEDFWVEVVLTAIELEGRLMLHTVWREIGDRKAAEQALQQSEAELRQKAQQLEQTLQELQQTQAQMIQSEKMSSLGQLVAGVAHEINNPVNFIYGNLNHANSYTQDLLDLIELYQQHHPNPHAEIQAQAEAIDLEFLKQDLPKLLNSMKVGADRIEKIVTSLRVFSRMDEAEMKAVDIHEGIDSTLLILQNRLKAKPDYPEIKIVKEYDSLPLVECYAGQLNQVFMNILANAIDALEESLLPSPQIFIQTERMNPQWIRILIADNGPGISKLVQQRIFDPFFTTKPIGKGTGMGMSISYQIVTEKHGGRLFCRSTPTQGAEFVIEIPVEQRLHTFVH